MTHESAPPLIALFTPSFDAPIAERVIVRSDTSRTFLGVRELDFLSVHTPLLDVAMWARGVPARLSGRTVEAPPRLVLGQGDPLSGWLALGEQPN